MQEIKENSVVVTCELLFNGEVTLTRDQKGDRKPDNGT